MNHERAPEQTERTRGELIRNLEQAGDVASRYLHGSEAKVMQDAVALASGKIRERKFAQEDIQSIGGLDTTAALLIVESLEQATNDPDVVEAIFQRIGLIPPFLRVGAWEGVIMRVKRRTREGRSKS